MGSTSQPGPLASPEFEGFAIEIVDPARRGEIEARITREIGPGWTVQPFGDRGTDFEIVGGRARSVGEAWEDTYKLRAIPGVVYAEPLFEVAISERPDERDLAPRRRTRSGGGGDTHLPSSNIIDWSLDRIGVLEAWERFFPGNASPARGIVIGHPDTGYRRHPEIVPALALENARDFVDEDDDPTDPLVNEGTIPNPGHGTATGSVIVSPRGAQAQYQTRDVNGECGVLGVAPGARLMPLRVAKTVVLFSMKNLSRAIEHAADNGAHVISISMGGLFSFRLRAAVTYAQKRGVIICAAAGNQVRFVVWPAAYDEVIAVAACNADDGIWSGSSRGDKVDVTAPGESVWRAHVTEKGHAVDPDVGRGSGTSYAVATTAGVAALWLAHHGRDALAKRYGAEKIPFIFNDLLRRTCTPMPAWEAGKFGAGRVNVVALLAAPLPDPLTRTVRAPGRALEVHPPEDTGKLETFAHLFESSVPMTPAPRTRGASRPDALSTALTELLNVAPEELSVNLDEIGQELAFHLATDPALYERFERALRRPSPRTRGARTRGKAAAAKKPDTRAARQRLRAADTSRALAGRLEK